VALTITAAQFAQLKKVMALTTSTNDGEALAALRRANAVLAAARLTWPEVLGKTVSVEAGYEYVGGDGSGFRAAARSGAAYAHELMDVALALDADGKLTDGQREFVSDLQRYLDRNGYLTDNQLAALRQLIERKTHR
jgi:hypothetical protein